MANKIFQAPQFNHQLLRIPKRTLMRRAPFIVKMPQESAISIVRNLLAQAQWCVSGYVPVMHYICCSRQPNSQRDITDTQSRYADRKLYITLNCRRTFQIWRITDIDKKVSFTNVEIIPLSVLGHFMVRPLVLVIRSFVLVSVSLFRLNSSRRGTVTFVLVFVWCSRW